MDADGDEKQCAISAAGLDMRCGGACHVPDNLCMLEPFDYTLFAVLIALDRFARE